MPKALVGPGSPMKTANNKPSGKTKQGSDIGQSRSASNRIVQAAYVVLDRNPSSVKNNPIGLNRLKDESDLTTAYRNPKGK